MPASQHRIIRADILAPEDYVRERAERRRALVAMKQHRRVAVGPYATFYFENYTTMWAQVHEMLYIEKGGEEQIEGELAAYNPLIPQGRELIATLMLEIDDPVRRLAILSRLGGIEETAYLGIGAARIKAAPTDYEDRTTPEGKTSSVHWVRFAFTPAQIVAIRSDANAVILGLAHPHYGHMAVLAPQTRAELAKDFG